MADTGIVTRARRDSQNNLDIHTFLHQLRKSVDKWGRGDDLLATWSRERMLPAIDRWERELERQLERAR